MSGRGAPKKDDGQTDTAKVKGGKQSGTSEKQSVAEAKVDKGATGGEAQVVGVEKKTPSTPAQKVTPVASVDEKVTVHGAEKGRGTLPGPSVGSTPSGRQESVKGKETERNKDDGNDKKVGPVASDGKKKTSKDEKKGPASATDVAAGTSKAEKGGVSKDKTSPVAKGKQTEGSAKTKVDVAATRISPRDTVAAPGKTESGKKSPATSATPKGAEKSSVSKGVDPAIGALKASVGAPPTAAPLVASKTDTKKDKSSTSVATVASTKKEASPDAKKGAKPKDEVKSLPVPEKKEPLSKTTPTKTSDRPKEAKDIIIQTKNGKPPGDETSQNKVISNGKSGDRSVATSQPSKQEKPEVALISTKDDKTSKVAGQMPEKKSPTTGETPKEKKTVTEQKGLKDSVSKSSQQDVPGSKHSVTSSRIQPGKSGGLSKETSPKTLPKMSPIEEPDKRITVQHDSQIKTQTTPQLPSVDKVDASQKIEARKSPSTTQGEKLTTEVPQKETKGKRSPSTPESKVVDVTVTEVQDKRPSTNAQSPKVDDPKVLQKGAQSKRSPPADTAQKDVPGVLKLSPQEPKAQKTPVTFEMKNLDVRDPEHKGASYGKLPTTAKEADDDKSMISRSEPRLFKEPASTTSKAGGLNGGDSSKDSKQQPLRKPSSTEQKAPDSKLPPTSNSDKPSPASENQKRLQFSDEPCKTEPSPTAKETTTKQKSPTSPKDQSVSSGELLTGKKQPPSRKTPTEHKTIVQMLQEAREEALPRGERKTSDFKAYSKSEMVLPGAPSNGARHGESEKQMTSSPNLKVQNGASIRSEDAKKGTSRKAESKSIDVKEISKSEAVLPAVATKDGKKPQETEKQMTSSPNLAVARNRHVSSVEGLQDGDAIARSSPSVAVINGMHRGHRASEKRDSRKGSINSDTAGIPDQGARARSATWSQAAVPASNVRKEDSSTEAVPSTDSDWDKRWSSAGSDILNERVLGRVPSNKGTCPVPIGAGKEWRSEGLGKANGTCPANGAVAKGGSTDTIKRTSEVARGSVDRRAWESEAGLARQATTKGYPKFEAPYAAEPKPTKNGTEFRRDMKDLVSPSGSTASKGSGIEKASEASGSYHSVASSTHRRDSKSEPATKEHPIPKHVVASAEDKQPDATIESGDMVKLIEEEKGAEDGREKGVGRQGLEVECIVEVGRERKGSRGSGRSHRGGGGRSREQQGVENRGADLERALEEEEEAAAGGREQGARLRPYIDLWDNDDKFSVANSQLPLNPAGEEDAGSIGSMLTTEPERGNWTGRFDFLLSLLGYSVGLGNVWRFPYLCYNNGGGAFLIPFTIMLVIAGLPLMFMELSFGQYANLGPAAIYSKFCPLFHGLGYGMVIVSTVVMLYYNLIIAWTIFYMFASLNKQLPWANCEPEWSTLDCYSYEIADICLDKNGTYYQRTCYNETEAAIHNITQLAEVAEKRPPAEEYFNNYVLGLSKGIEETGEIRLSMALCLLLAWAIVFLCLSKGVQSSGKVVYFTALFPYVVLIILFVRGVTLPGASTGILFYLTPDWKRLANAQVWGDAAVQIFFALSPAWGGLITLASYNKFSNNCYKDSLIVAVSNILTSFFAGFVIFSVIGFLAHELNVEVKKVVDQGAGLAFIVYPEVVTRLPVSPVWSLLFFVMLLTLGLDSQFALMETVTTAILDRFPNLREKKVWVVLVVAVLGYFGGLIFTTNSGMYWLQLMDKYAANWSVLLIAISECILIAWVYGADRFLRDVQEMIGPKSRLWMFFWCWMWKLVTPATLLFILFFNWVEYAPATYGEYIYPLWADAAGWVIGVFPVLVIIGAGVVKVYTAPEASLRDRFKRLLQPTPDWGPTLKRSSAPPTYDSIRNTIVLMNGLPVIQETHADGESLEDNTL